jgi:diguanylate cyclase (GGDEF)-like protein
VGLLQNKAARVFKNDTRRELLIAFMQQALVRLILLTAMVTQPLYAQPATTLVLDHDVAQVPLDASLGLLFDASGQLTVDQIEKQPGLQFAPAVRGQRHLLGDGALWMRFDAVIKSPAPHWRLTMPMPTLDDVTLYYRDPAGQWVRQQAGDTRPMRSWAQHGRYPVFDLSPETAQTVRYYLQIRHARVPYSILPRIVSNAQFIESRQNEHLLLGIYFGLAMLVIMLALANALACRDAAFGIFALYVAMFAGAQATYTGLARLYAWPDWPSLNNACVTLLLLLSSATALWFARTVTTPRRYSRALDGLMLALMGLLPLAGVLDLLLSTPESFLMLNILGGVSMAALTLGVSLALFEGDRDTRWVALGFSPILLATLFLMLRNLGVIATGFWTEYGRMIASVVEVPILFYGLHRRVSQSRNLSARTTALRNTDPLTGLHSAKVLLRKMRQSLATAGRQQRPCALLLVNLTNLARLQKQHGRETADRAMVMAAARIREIAHATDTVARVGDTQFALLMEGPINAEAANNVATKILASGLRPSNQLPDAEPLRFHIAIGHLGDTAHVAEAEACLARMLQALQAMNDGSRKAIRLVKL